MRTLQQQIAQMQQLFSKKPQIHRLRCQKATSAGNYALSSPGNIAYYS
jgi:hypothetical protein